MSCKSLRIVCFSAALTLPQLAVAADSKAPDAAALGQFESIFDSCSAARPESAENYKKQRDKLTNGVAEKDLAGGIDLVAGRLFGPLLHGFIGVFVLLRIADLGQVFLRHTVGQFIALLLVVFRRLGPGRGAGVEDAFKLTQGSRIGRFRIRCDSQLWEGQRRRKAHDPERL